MPALALDGGELVTEGPVIVQMIADKAPAKNLAPARDTAERYKLLEWLNYITTELHKNFGPMFSPVLADDAKAFFKDRAMGKFKYLETQLAGRDYLMGKQFTVADGYLFTMLMWATDRLKFDLSGIAEPDGLQGPRRRAPEGAGGADQGRAVEGGVRFWSQRCKEGPDRRSGPFVMIAQLSYHVVPANAGTTNLVTPPPASSAGSGRRRSRPWRPCPRAALAG